MREITIPKPSLVLLVGPSGSGKSTFAGHHFCPTEVLSSDFFRSLISDDEGDQAVTAEAFEVLHLIAESRLKRNRLTVIDATNLDARARRPLLTLSERYHVLTVAIVFNLPEACCQLRNEARPGRMVDPLVVRRQFLQLQDALICTNRERYHGRFVLDDEADVQDVRISLEPLGCDRRRERGPFDVVGDVHGCYDELLTLLELLGYTSAKGPSGPKVQGSRWRHPQNRRLVFVGDLVGGGPKNLETFFLVADMVRAGDAFCVLGDHEWELRQWLRGTAPVLSRELQEVVGEVLEIHPDVQAPIIEEMKSFIDGLEYHLVLDHGDLIVSHAGIPEYMQGRVSEGVRGFCLYGEGVAAGFGAECDPRTQWTEKYSGTGRVVYGHTPAAGARWYNRTVNIDTGCVSGGELTALRYPERRLVSVKAGGSYFYPR